MRGGLAKERDGEERDGERGREGERERGRGAQVH